MRLHMFLITIAYVFAATPALGREGLSLATGLMALTNATTQGGKGSEGSTFLTQTDASYHADWWGAGLYLQADKQGECETDMAAGPRLELSWDPFYFEIGYAVLMRRSFTDRAIAEQEGKGYQLGFGTRFPVGSGGAFLQFSYKLRTQMAETQDGSSLPEPITQLDGYPLGGIGVGF